MNREQKMKAHPEFNRLIAERKRLDESNIPLEDRKIKVDKEFYELCYEGRFMGFELMLEDRPPTQRFRQINSIEQSLVFSAEKK